MKHFNTKHRTALLWLMVLLTSLSSYAQKMVGDGFGGRAGYNPVNIFSGTRASGIICPDKTLHLWGITDSYLNNGVNSQSVTPVAVTNVSNVRQVSMGSAGGSRATYIKDDGTGYLYGESIPYNNSLVSNAYYTDAATPGFAFVKTDGTVWTGGSSNFAPSCLCTNGAPTTYCTSQLAGISNAKRVAISNAGSMVILLSDGTVKTIFGTTNQYPASLISSTPITIPGLSNIVDVKAGESNFYALTSSGQVYAWGNGFAMGTGVSQTTSLYTPQLITFPAGAAPIKAIVPAKTSIFCLALDENGVCYEWGSRLTTSFNSTPVAVATNVRDMAAGYDFAFFYKNDGTLWGLGYAKNMLNLSSTSTFTTLTQLSTSSLCAIQSYNGMPPCVAGTTAPALTPTTATNSCPTATVNLASLAISSTTPSGASLIWSTHKTPTSAGDTLTTAQKTAVSTAGKYYAMYYDAANACYSPADSVEVTITPCAVNLANACPTATVNLMTAISATNMPSGATVTWHTGTPATTANKVADPTAVSTSGNYYMAYFDGTNNCYSETAGPLVVTITACVPDTDGDGIADDTDLDDDNDGILDTVEQAACSPSSLTCDSDGDGIINSLDLDSDNDGINDVIEAGGTDADKNGVADGTVSATGIPATANTGLTAPDTDGDGKKNPYDLDSDNDGINDLVESGNALLADANGDGMVDGTDTDKDGILGAADGTPSTWGDANDTAPVDTDGTGGANYIDTDSDGDGLTDLAESGIANPATLDANGDGKIDDATDTDGDGIPQGVDGAPTAFGDANSPALPDTDGDSKPDYIDAADTDGDGVPDATDLDDDNDGIPDSTEGTADTDGDGVKDALDLDSDNDGINDVIEAGGTDANGDGKQDGTANATTGLIGTGLTPPNTDNDNVPDYKDLDSDNDGVSDLQEGGSGGTDANNDGVVDGPDTDGDGIQNSVDGLVGFGDVSSPALPNGDSDTLPDYRDVDSDGDGINDIIEKAGKGTLDGNNDGMVDSPTDPDGDGIANNSGLDTIPAGFGGLPTANGPATDLFANYTFGNVTFKANDTRTVIININEIKGGATSGIVEFFVPTMTGYTMTFNATQTTATVIGTETVNNNDWTMTNTGTGMKFTSKSGVVISANGRSRIAITVKADTAGTAANLTTNITPASGGDGVSLNNVAVLSMSIQN
ncbi:hypothetical protein FHS57_006279 [Runella defluvii]|uniref:Ig-like domain-containing protein n=1 Tax=Runella defluvii TaxID=370973 RepID=A0A7W6ETY7_9BACT|nr:hypothetical protein [Runella defluvii]MBB3842248.1 hypothetical protein [Runella defluvii]